MEAAGNDSLQLTQPEAETRVIGPRRPPAIWLGDVVRAYAALRPPDDETRAAVAEIFGFTAVEGRTERARPSASDAVSVSLSSTVRVPSPDQREPVADTPEADRADSAAPAERALVPSVLEYVGQVQAQVRLEGSLTPSIGDRQPTELELQPLLLPIWTRAIVSRILATESLDGPVDVDACIDAIARRRWPREVPRVPLPTLRRGAQLLVDGSQALQPYVRDQAALERALKLVVGDALEVLRFVGCPSRGAGAGRRSLWPKEYVPPASGTVVLVVTDLGIGNPQLATERADVSEWVAFGEDVRRAGCQPMALVPYAPRRWPAEISKVMDLVYWDRSTTAGSVRRRVRRFKRAPA